jgi:alpha-L-rhamnosidase
MGLLAPEDWQATWIRSPRPLPVREEDFYQDQPAPLFRHEFHVAGRVARARAYVTGLGSYELRLNGERVGDRVLDPGWTDFGKRVYYSTYDVTDLVHEGANAVGGIVGNGWYNPLPLRMWGWVRLREALTVGPPRLLVQIVVETADGRRETVASDTSWRTTDSPILRNSIYLGERYDARLEQPGWDKPGFDDSAWQGAIEATEPVGRLEAEPIPPVRVIETLSPVAVTEPAPGVRIYDLGVNLAGRARIEAEGPAGSEVRLRYGELLHEDGTLNPMTSVAGQVKEGRCSGGPGAPPTAWQEDRYILRGEGVESWAPRFTFHGFRYVEVTGDVPTVRVVGERLHTDVERVGRFDSSNPLLDEIQDMTTRTLVSNLFSVQSDCPHREKFGYGGDIVASSDYAALNYDMHRFYAKSVRDLADAARPNGGFTETSPYVGIADGGLGEGSGPVGWGTAHPLLVWQLYTMYGDRDLLAEQYDAAARWVELLRQHAPDGILTNGISDHESLVEKPVPLTGTAFYYQNVTLVARMARALGRDGEADGYEALAREIAEAFNARFLDRATGRYFTGTQACQAAALYFGLEPPEQREKALEVLLADVYSSGAARLTTGIFGTKYLLMSLTDAGKAQAAMDLVNHREFPGWGFMLENGATTLWEHWAWSDDTFSHSHPMFGSVSEWLISGLAGLRPAPDAVGFDRILVRPSIVEGVDRARAEHRSVRGAMLSEWKRTGDRLRLHVVIPANATATAWVPTSDAASVRESGRPVASAEGVRVLQAEPGWLVCAVGSGDYRFESIWVR